MQDRQGRAVAPDDRANRARQPRGEPARPRPGRPVVKTAPSAADLYSKGEGYFLDFPGNPLQAGLHVRGGREGASRRAAFRCVRAYQRRGGRPREARPRVLVLLVLQRLQQQARERLGGHPARLRRRHRRGGARDGAHRGRVRPARGRRAGRVGRREAREGRRPPGRVPGGGVACELLLGPALARPGSERGDRLRRLDGPVPPGAAWPPSSCRGAAVPTAPSRGSPSRGFGARGRRRPNTGPTGPNTKDRWSAPITWQDDLAAAAWPCRRSRPSDRARATSSAGPSASQRVPTLAISPIR